MLERFWKARMQNLESSLEGQQIEKKGQQEASGSFLDDFQRSVRAWGEGLQDGGKANLAKVSSLALR